MQSEWTISPVLQTLPVRWYPRFPSFLKLLNQLQSIRSLSFGYAMVWMESLFLIWIEARSWNHMWSHSHGDNWLGQTILKFSWLHYFRHWVFYLMVFINFFQIVWDPILTGGSVPKTVLCGETLGGACITTPYIIKFMVRALTLGFLNLRVQINRPRNNRLSLKRLSERRIEASGINVKRRTFLSHLSAAINPNSKRLHLINDPLRWRHRPQGVNVLVDFFCR